MYSYTVSDFFMKTLRILILAGLSSVLPALAQVSADSHRFSPLATGYIERARTMRDAGNYAGVIDQLRHLDTQMVTLTPSEAEEYTFLLAEAYYNRDDADCLRLLIEFRDRYPASPLAPKAALAIGDFYFFRHQWADALMVYNDCDFDRLNRDDRLLYIYRRSLCLIKTGHFEEARTELKELKNAADYNNARTFYTAYLDYIDGNFNEAYNLFKKVPDDIKGLDAGYYMAQIEYSRGDYDSVISRGTSLLRRNPDPELAPEIDRIVGLSFFKKGELERAQNYLNDYLSTTESTPEPDALYATGSIDYANGRYNAAVQRFSEITDNNDAVGQGAWLYLGQCYLKQNNLSAAALAFEKAYRMNYDKDVSETALYNYITALTRGGKVPFSSSSDLLEEFVRRYPDSQYATDVETYLASSYYNDHNYPKALQYVNSVRNPSPEILSIKQKILYELGIELVSNGKPEEAIPYLQQCISLRNQDKNISAQASLWLGDAFFSLSRYKDAASSYQTFIKDDVTRENRALGLYDLAYAQYKLSNYEASATNFLSALSSKPALEPRLANDARIRLGDCLYYLGKYGQASEYLSQAISSNATDADYALYRRAILHGLNGNTKAKLDDLSLIEKNYPDSRWLSKALLEKAATYEETGQAALAADAYKKRLGITAEVDIDELLRMASAMNQASRWEDLIDVVDRIRHAGGLEPDELAEIDLYEADALSGLGRNAEAADIYSHLAGNPNSLPGAKAIVSLAEYDLKKGDYESARVRMEEFTDVGSSHQYWLARGFITLADAYNGLGQTSLAKEYILSLQENYPGNEPDIKSMISTRLKTWK